MSIYPDWIGVDLSTGGVILVDGHSVEFVNSDIDIDVGSEIIVALENSEVNVEYGN